MLKNLCLKAPKWSAAILYTASLVACGSGSPPQDQVPLQAQGNNSSSFTTNSSVSSSSRAQTILAPDTSSNPALPQPSSIQWQKAIDAQRFLTQATFGATAKSLTKVIDLGVDAWIDEQFTIPPTSHLERLDARIEHYGYEVEPPYIDHSQFEMVWIRNLLPQDIWWESAIWGKDQLRQRIANVLSQILVVSERHADLYAYERGFANYHDILAKHAFGNYRDLLIDITLNPVMGNYLSTVNNQKENEEENIRPDENFSREIMQLFSLGLYQINIDGTPILDSNGLKIPTYTQDDIKQLARVFTGWQLAGSQEFGGWAPPSHQIHPMVANEAFHDYGEKKILKNIIAEGLPPTNDLISAIDIIFAHNNVAPFISGQLIRHLITSNPSNEYVARVATVFNNNGNGIKGDMKAVIRAIYLDGEARNIDTDNSEYYGRLKELPLTLSGIWRAFRAQGIPLEKQDGSFAVNTIRYNPQGPNLEQRAYNSPSVFNFYQQDYRPSSLKENSVAPEFQMFTNSGAILQANLLSNIIYSRHLEDSNLFNEYRESGKNWISSGWSYPDVKARLNLSDEIELASEPEKLLNHLNLLLTGGQLSPSDIDAIKLHIEKIGSPLERVYEAIFIISVSPEYAIQR